MSKHQAFRIITLAFGLHLILATRTFAGPPFLTDDPEPVDYQHWENYLFATGDHEGGGYTINGPAVELNYGPLPDTQLSLTVPMTSVGGNTRTPPVWAMCSWVSNIGFCMRRMAGRKSPSTRRLLCRRATRRAAWAADAPGFNCRCGCKKAGDHGRLTAAAARH
jgi:hypothetical protein